MAKIAFVCYRDSNLNPNFHRQIEILTEVLTPDNIEPVASRVIIENGVYIGIFNPNRNLPIKYSSVCMGNLINPEDSWWKPMMKVPDGSYALFRSDPNSVELVSDIVASRTIWYAMTEKMFVASTSQRAVVFFLQDFELNREVIPWMMSSGTLGPGLSWDRRIRCLPGNSSLFLDRHSWEKTLKTEPVEFDYNDISMEEQETLLRVAIEDTFHHLSADYSIWALPLSGGYDSRALFLMLKNRGDINCITWGLKSSINDRLSDAYVAKLLASHYQCNHRYFETDVSSEPIETIINRFLVAGEGRIDNIAGYMDGFAVWKYLFDSGYQGIIRGDQAFGCKAVSNFQDIYRNMGLTVCSDYEDRGPIREVNLCFDQRRPLSLERRGKETIECWRDRVYAEFEIPTKFAALNDLKLPYVEVINPFLSRKIVKQVRRLSDRFRTNKALYKKIINNVGPGIKIAQRPAIDSLSNILQRQDILSYVSEELNSDYGISLLSRPLIHSILQSIGTSSNGLGINNKLRSYCKNNIVIKRLLNKYYKISGNGKYRLDIGALAFRALIICKMAKMLYSDGQLLKKALSCQSEHKTDDFGSIA